MRCHCTGQAKVDAIPSVSTPIQNENKENVYMINEMIASGEARARGWTSQLFVTSYNTKTLFLFALSLVL